MIKIFNWVTKETSIDFMKARKIAYAFSGLCFIASLALMGTRSFNYGIDFSGGILIEVKSAQVIDVEEMRKTLEVVGLDDLNLQSIGQDGTEVMIRAQAKNLDEKGQMQAVNSIKAALGTTYEYRRVELVGPQVGHELKLDGIIAAALAILAISAYIWVRFEWQFALGAMAGLIHDVVIVCGLVSLFDIDFSLTTVAAILTFAGYSMNDTVVTFDRVRENLRKYKKMPQYELLNKSFNDILSRTILTGITTLLACASLYFFGGKALQSFSFPLFWGILLGTYSSIYVSGVILNFFDLHRTSEEVKVSPFGNA